MSEKRGGAEGMRGVGGGKECGGEGETKGRNRAKTKRREDVRLCSIPRYMTGIAIAAGQGWVHCANA